MTGRNVKHSQSAMHLACSDILLFKHIGIAQAYMTFLKSVRTAYTSGDKASLRSDKTVSKLLRILGLHLIH